MWILSRPMLPSSVPVAVACVPQSPLQKPTRSWKSPLIFQGLSDAQPHVAAEGGAAGVVRDDDSLENHFNDTVSGGDWLCEQDVVSTSSTTPPTR